MKTCYKCNNEKLLSEFNKNKSKKDGHSDECKECCRLYKQQYYHKNKSKVKEKTNEYRINNKDRVNQYWKGYRKENDEQVKEYRAKSKKKHRENINKYEREKRQNEPLYKLRGNLRTTIWRVFNRNGYSKTSKTQDILGCSFEDLKQHIESQWEEWMSWDNYGRYNGEEGYGWDIDHIIPVSSAINEDEVIKLNHFTNLQPLCSYINRDVKQDKII